MFQNNVGITRCTRYYLLLIEITDYNVGIDGRNFFNQPVKNNFITYDDIQKIATAQGDDYTTGCLLNHNYFNNHYKMTAIDLSKNKKLMLIQKQYSKSILLQI